MKKYVVPLTRKEIEWLDRRLEKFAKKQLKKERRYLNEKN